MKNKNLIIGLVLAAALIGLIVVARPSLVSKKIPKKAQARLAKVKKEAAQPLAKKVISKDKGGLTVKITDYKKKELSLKARAFKVIDAKSSRYVASFVTNRMQELSPGNYDIEIDTIPQTIYKNVGVDKGREKVEEIGCITASLNVKILNAKKKEAYYPVRVLYSKTNDVVASATTNRPIEIASGVYDIDVNTLPRQLKKDVKVESDKEMILDLGCATGILIVKVFDENKKELRFGARVTRPENNEFVTTASTNKPLELLQGTYNVELPAAYKGSKKDAKISAGEETVVEFLVETPPVPSKTAPTPPTKLEKR